MPDSTQLDHISQQLDRIASQLSDMGSRVDDHSGRLLRIETGYDQHLDESGRDRRRLNMAVFGPDTGEWGADRGLVGMLQDMRHEQKQAEARTRMRVVVAGVAVPPATALLLWYLTFLFGTTAEGVL